MRILNICQDDWANFACDNAMALRSVGVDADCIKRNKHISNYDSQGTIISDINAIKKEIEKYDVIQFFHDNTQLFRLLYPSLENKKVIAYHTSSVYRKDYKSINDLMNPIIYRSVCAMPEFMGMGGKNSVYMVGAVDTDRLVPEKRNITRPYQIAHYPSNSTVKGSEAIIDMLLKTEKNFKYDYSYCHIKYSCQLRRMADCDIYIEMFSMVDGNGSAYGNFGITALEASALGKIVVTNCKDIDVYMANYPECELQIANSQGKFISMINGLCNLSEKQIESIQESTREWVVKYHSYKASGEYILKNIL